MRRCEGASHCSGVGNVEHLDAKGLLDLNLNPLNFLRSALNLDPNLIFRTWVYWKSRCGWVCEVRPTKTQMYLWCELNLEMGCVCVMAIRVVEFSNGGYKIRKVFA